MRCGYLLLKFVRFDFFFFKGFNYVVEKFEYMEILLIERKMNYCVLSLSEMYGKWIIMRLIL